MKEGYCEMTPSEQGFLCGLIRKFLPEKIVEIGVAGGGTTAVIMNCLNLLKSDAKMYSVDINKECYRRKGKVSGYQLREVKDYLPNYKNHTFLLGKILPNVIEKIGKEIDFVVLDTRHTLPGELLDFLCILPYLRDGAVVVFHDITLNLKKKETAYATKIVLDMAEGEKYLNFHDGNLNIGAIQIGEETRENIANVFSTFSITWQYFPKISEILTYRKIYAKYYDEECMELFDIFVEAQYNRLKEGSFILRIKNRMNQSEKLFKLICSISDRIRAIIP